MEKKVFIVHGWGGYTKEGWFPWLKKELSKKGFKVKILSMPDTEYPTIKRWVSFLKKNVKSPDKNTYFIGHSIGCQTILRYLEKLRKNEKIGGAIFVAGWFNLINLEKNEVKIAKPWLEKKINLTKITAKSKKNVSIFSNNDPVVPLSDYKIFKEKLNSKIIIQRGKGHFSGSDKIKKLPIVLKELLKISK